MKVKHAQAADAHPRNQQHVLHHRQSLIALLSASKQVALGIGEPVALDGCQPYIKRPSNTPSPKPRQFQAQTM